MKFDGKNIPFANKSNDVSMICYVLHHLEYNHAKFLINEAIRVSKSKLIILEDTMPVFNLFYKVRNWCHATEANLEYSVRSEDFMQNFNHNMFKTHKEWEDFFKEFDTVKKIDIISLKHISQYAHHTMLVITLKEKE
jgi:hypothetical protein